MSAKKKQVREAFRNSVFKRDEYKCRTCGKPGTEDTLDAHHITDRNLLPSGGYVKENGISLCDPCHHLAEDFPNGWTSNGPLNRRYNPEHLYKLIGSNFQKAYTASKKTLV